MTSSHQEPARPLRLQFVFLAAIATLLLAPLGAAAQMVERALIEALSHVDQFGEEVALDGDTLAVAAPGESAGEGGFYSGVVRVYAREGETWSLDERLESPEEGFNAGLSRAVAVSGDTILAGAAFGAGATGSTGAAYVFVRSAEGWTVEQKLIAADGTSFDRFGLSVALDGDTAVVGAPYRESEGGASGNFAGAAYVFVRSAGVWTFQAKLGSSELSSGDYFGWSLALQGNRLIVGATGVYTPEHLGGAAYVFERENGAWTQKAVLLRLGYNPQASFGLSVALDGDTALVGAGYERHGGQADGGAYVFARGESGWMPEARLHPPWPPQDRRFGWRVALLGDAALIAAPRDSAAGSLAGGAYYFRRVGSTWSRQQRIYSSDPDPFEYFGGSVALDGDGAAIGAPGGGSGGRPGAAHLFTTDGVVRPLVANGLAGR